MLPCFANARLYIYIIFMGISVRYRKVFFSSLEPSLCQKSKCDRKAAFPVAWSKTSAYIVICKVLLFRLSLDGLISLQIDK